MKVFPLLILSLFIAICGQLLLKQGMNVFGQVFISQLSVRLLSMVLNPFVLVGLVCYCLSAVLWLVIISRAELSLVYPMLSISYVLVVFLSWIIFRENVSLVRWIGVTVICLGVVILSRS